MRLRDRILPSRFVLALTCRWTIVIGITLGASQLAVAQIGLADSTLKAEIANLIANGLELRKARRLGAADSAITFFDSASVLTRARFGSTDTVVAFAEWQSALCYLLKGDFRRLDSLVQSSIAVWEANCGPGDRHVGYCLRILAESMRARRRIQDCEELFLRAIRILNACAPPEDQHLAIAYGGIGNLYRDQGRLQESDSAFWTAQKHWDREGLRNYWDTIGTALNHTYLRGVYLRNHDYEKALTHAKSAVDLIEGASGFNSSWMAEALRMTGDVYFEQERFEEARPYFEKALSINEAAFGKRHPNSEAILHQLSWSNMRTGRIREAHDECNDILEANVITYGIESPITLAALRDIMALESATGDEALLREHFARYRSIQGRFLEDIFSGSSEEMKITYSRDYPSIIDAAVSYVAARPDSPMLSDVLDMVIQGKGYVLDALMRESNEVRCSPDAELQALANERRDVCSQLAKSSYDQVIRASDAPSEDSINILRFRKAELDREISAMCESSSSEARRSHANTEALQQALSEPVALLEYVSYDPPLKALGQGYYDLRPRYAVFVIRHEGRPYCIDVGDGLLVDSLIHETLEQIETVPEFARTKPGIQQHSRLDSLTSRLYDLLLAPVDSCLSGIDHLLISPDGSLGLMPFAALSTNGEFAIEKREISYLSSGRDILESKTHDNPNVANIVVDPDYDHVIVAGNAPDDSSSPQLNAQVSRSAECDFSEFERLWQTRREGDEIKSVIDHAENWETHLYTGADASEGRLKSLDPPPRVLHLATHGYFCELGGQGNSSENPLVNSGLVLAGVNDRSKSNSVRDDGFLTALEAAHLNLDGTELVVVSACKSGYGAVRPGVGIYGLRRSILEAGAQSLLVSAFEVPDLETQQFMSSFYAHWLGGETKGAAARLASLEILKEKRSLLGYANPYYWAGFMLIGATGIVPP